MQYTALLLIVFLIGVAAQNWNMGKYDPTAEEALGFGRYMTNKRALNGQLRRSSIRWGKRTNEDDVQELIPLPEDFMVLWPAPAVPAAAPEMKSSLALVHKNKPQSAETQTTSTATPENQETQPESRIMERVAKAGIRPKLALSSRLWGR